MTTGPTAIATWPAFRAALRESGARPLDRHGAFPAAVYVGGCQRSGSTLMAQVLNRHGVFADYRTSRTLELDSALLLSGLVLPSRSGRYVFHTTYLNDDVSEYGRLSADCRLIWMLRRPDSVVHSMLYNWSPLALNNLFASCGVAHLPSSAAVRYARWGRLSVRRPLRAACAYAGKTSQLHDLAGRLGPNRLMVVVYDDLVGHPEQTVRRVCQFAGVPFEAELIDGIHRSSLQHADRLSRRARDLIDRLCAPVYASAIETGRRLDASRSQSP